MLIFKILTAGQWSALNIDGSTAGAPVDLADGFIHFSTAGQLAATAAKHFAWQGDLVLAAVDPARFGDALKWEPARGGELFPHLYATLGLDDISWARPLPVGPDGVHSIPPEVSA